MERDRLARERVAAERERAVERAGREFVRLSAELGSGVGEGVRAGRLRAELSDPDRATCCGAPLDGSGRDGTDRKYVERHKRGISSLGLPPSPVCSAASSADYQARKAGRTEG